MVLKVKSWPKTMKKKPRYVFFRLFSEKKLDQKSVFLALLKSLKDLLGILGAAESGFELVWFHNNLGAVKTNPEWVEKLVAAFCLMREIGDEKAAYQTLLVSGTLAAGKKKLAERRFL